ncbi:MAG: Kelch repeat-containing protein [Bacteroidota bacterium]
MKKITLIISFIFLGFITAVSQPLLEFRDHTTMPEARGAISSVSDGSNLYVINGFTADQFSGKIDKFNTTDNSWSILTSELIPRQYSSAVILGEELYVFNGDVNDDKLNRKTEIVNLKTGVVTLTTDNPHPAHAGGVAVWNDIIYSFGGKNSPVEPMYSNRMYCFDPSSKRWIKLAPMPEAKEAKGVMVEGKLYVIGGNTGKASNRIDMYNTETNTWTQLADLPVGISGNSVVAHGSKIYTLFDSKNQNYVGCYDIPTNTFSVVKSNKMIARKDAGAQVINDKLYIFGGSTDDKSKNVLSSVQVADLK